MLDFNAIASQKISEIEAVPLAPVGIYRWRVSKLPTTRDFQGKDGRNWQAVEFPIQVVAAEEVDDIDSYAGKVTEIKDRLSFMFDRADEADFLRFQNNLKKFFVSTLKCVDDTASLAEGINASVNQQFLAGITWAPDKQDAEIIRTQVGRPAPLA